MKSEQEIKGSEMEAELFRDCTFFNGIINDSKLQIPGEEAKKPGEKKPRKKSPSSPATGAKPRTGKSSGQKENLTPEKNVKRVSKKGGREPLKVLNKKTSTPKKTGAATGKSCVSPAKRGRPSNRPPSPSKEKKVEKKENVRRSAPKIIIHEDSPAKEKTRKKEGGKEVGRLSKSWDGSSASGRRSLEETKKSSKTLNQQNQKRRHTFNELASIKSPNDNKKSPIKRSPGKRTLLKLKPGQPEFEDMLTKLETLFPNADPEFMKSIFIKFKGCISKTIEFIIYKEKTNELPTKFEYVRRKGVEKLEEKFWESFSVQRFVELIPDPWEYFLKTEKRNCEKYIDHSLYYLKNKYKKHYVYNIQKTLLKCENSLYLANKELRKKNRLLKMRVTDRSKSECKAGKPRTFVVQFLYEVAFIENESKIKNQIKKVETARYKKFTIAKQTGALLECQSCNDFSLLPDDAVNCPANHVFCKDCVVKYVEVEIGKDNFQFKCLIKCEEKFSTEALKVILNPLVMATIIKRNQLEEIKSAGIEDLVSCPFCYFIVIMPPEMSVLNCLNPSCKIESCRFCKQLNHVPMKCDELKNFDKSFGEAQVKEEEKEEEGKEVEEVEGEKEAEAEAEVVEEEKEEEWVFKCAHCKGKFVKVDPNSDRMICPCGTSMCSICQQLLSRCSHVNPAPAHRLSSSDETDYAEIVENVQGRNSDGEFENKILEFLSSESDTF